MKTYSQSTDVFATLKIIVVIFTCISLIWVAFYPGFMSHDSIMQFGISKSLKFNDWHPPVMSFVWSILGFFFPGPSGLLALHLGIFWVSIFIWYQNYRVQYLSWLIFIIPFFPWILNFEGTLWKDVGMAFSLFLLSSLSQCRPTARKVFLALFCVIYAINLRYNAILATIPILFLLIYRWFFLYSFTKTILTTISLVFFSVSVGSLLNYNILNSEKLKPSNYIIIDDLVYLSVKNNQSFLPGLNINELKVCASEEINQTRLVGRIFCSSTAIQENQQNLLNADLKKIWFSKVLEFPLEYFKFRMLAFGYLLRSPDSPPYYIWHPGIDDNSFGIKQVPNVLTITVEKYVKNSADFFPFFFKPYWWLLFSVFLLLASFKLRTNKTKTTAQVLLVSSIFYILGYIPLTPMADFRYVYWSVLSTSFAFLILLIDWPNINSGISRK